MILRSGELNLALLLNAPLGDGSGRVFSWMMGGMMEVDILERLWGMVLFKLWLGVIRFFNGLIMDGWHDECLLSWAVARLKLCQ